MSSSRTTWHTYNATINDRFRKKVSSLGRLCVIIKYSIISYVFLNSSFISFDMHCHVLKAIWLHYRTISSFKLITQRTPGNFIHKFQILNIHVRQRIKSRNRRSALASHF